MTIAGTSEKKNFKEKTQKNSLQKKTTKGERERERERERDCVVCVLSFLNATVVFFTNFIDRYAHMG